MIVPGSSMLDVASYLDRIGYTGPTSPTIDTLRAIHIAHLQSVPFENLDIAQGRKISLEIDQILRKIVQQRRGGFCYELNGALSALLRALGFKVTLLSARVGRETGGEGPEFDHLALRVDLQQDLQQLDFEQSWLADVGFGELFLAPLRLESSQEQVDPVGTFRLMKFGDRLKLEKFQPEKQWKPQYSFAQQPRKLADFAGMCQFHQTSPDSHFTQNRVCTRATREGRITLSGMKLIVTRNGRREEKILSSDQEWSRALSEHFGINL
jgi:N-hydroxyarylamine O-acetyltransferase